MDKKLRKEISKRILAIVLILVLLQSYFVNFAYIVKATSEITIGENVENSEDDVVVGEDDSKEVEETETGTKAENEENSEEVVVGDDNSNLETPVQSEELNAEEENKDGSNEEVVAEENSAEPVEEEQEENIEPEITLNVTSENASIYKGYLYANATSDLRYATNYNTIDEVTIKGGKNITTLTVQDEADKIGLITNTKIALLSDMCYVKTRISVEEFNQILGEDGIITAYDAEGVVIGTISKETNVVNNEYVLEYPYQTNSIKFEITGIKADGSISIKNDKEIKESSVYSRDQISLFSVINTIVKAQMQVGEDVKEYSAEGNINLEETESKMTIDVDNNTLSVEETNEVAINVTMKTDQERYDLFENPEITIEFPSAVEEVEITGINLLYKNGLSVDNWNVYTNSLGKKAIKITLKGSQLEYTPGAVGEGTTLVVYTKIDVNRLTADTSENLKLTYMNKDTIRKSYMLEGKESEDVTLNFVGKQEIVKASKINIENVGTVISYDDEIEKIEIDSESKNEQNVTLTGTIVNNFEATVEGVVIVGRIPFIGNKDGNGNDLGTNFNTNLLSAIALSGVVADVYYSEDGEAQKDDNTWTEDVSNLENYKSFKIVVREGKLLKGERVDFDLNLKVPAQVGYNAKAYATYTVYYLLDGQLLTGNNTVGMYTEERELTVDDLDEDAIEQVATLSVGTQVSQGGTILSDGDSVYERQILKYTVVVTNTSDVTAKNITIKGNAKNGNLYYFKTWLAENYEGGDDCWLGRYEEDVNNEKEYEEFVIENLAPGESKTFEYQIVIKENVEEVYGNIVVAADKIEESTLKTITNVVKDAEVEIRLSYKGTEAVNEIDKTSNSAFYFKIYLKNLSGRKLENSVLNINLPDALQYTEDSYIEGAEGLKEEIKDSVNGKILVIYIPEMESTYENEIFIPTTVKSFDTSLESINVNILANINVGDNVYYSNDYSVKVYQSESRYEYTWTSDIVDDKLENGQVVTYTFNIKNAGIVNIKFTNIYNEVPNGLVIEEVKLDDEVLDYDENTVKISEIIELGINEEKTLTIKARVNEDYFLRDQAVIENKLTVDGGKFFEEFETNVISYKINNTNVTVIATEKETETDESNDNLSENLPADDNNTNNNQEDNLENNSSNNDNNQDNNNSDDMNDTMLSEETKELVYNISGRVWLDKNKDGKRDSNEDGKNGITVMLYGANSESGIDISKLIATTSTNSAGEYSFSEVKNGNYVVVFEYDAETYAVTKYQISTALSNENSDVVSKKTTIGNELSTYGMTDVLQVNGSSLINIDMGLVTKNDFDLSLEKYLSEVVVKNDEGTKTYNYEKGTNEKIEINSKYYKSTILDITYKLVITNEGEITGYVNKLVDYIPEGMIVDLNLNPGWYYGDDGNLYYNGLVGKEIEAGSSEEVTLTLRKTLTDGAAVKLTNAAEIIDCTNSLGLEDIDSTVGNRNEKEDDYGLTTLIVSISTGRLVQYIVLSLIIIIIIVAIILVMIIKRKNIKKIYK
jgi:hypothetical protein